MPDALRSRPHESQTCAFCRIIRSEEQASIVFEDNISLAFLDRRPLFPGHCLLVPKAHLETLADLPPSLVGPLFQNAQLLERAIEEGLAADGTFVAINNRVSQSVPHVHIHLVPPHRKDGLKRISLKTIVSSKIELSEAAHHSTTLMWIVPLVAQ